MSFERLEWVAPFLCRTGAGSGRAIENVWEVTPGLLDVIHFDMGKAGLPKLSDEPGSVILPESMAKENFQGMKRLSANNLLPPQR